MQTNLLPQDLFVVFTNILRIFAIMIEIWEKMLRECKFWTVGWGRNDNIHDKAPSTTDERAHVGSS